MNDKLDASFFSFLRLGLWGREENGTEERADLSEEEWAALFTMAGRQSVSGIWVDGVAQSRSRPPETVWDKWVVGLLFLRQGNLRMRKMAEEWLIRLEQAGIRAFVFKGVSVAGWYREPLYRTLGDLDLVVTSGWDKLEGLLAGCGLPWASEHGDFKVEDHGLLVEFHRKAEYLYNPFMQRRLQKVQRCLSGSREFYWLCLVFHLRRHCLLYGIGLKQVCDVAVMLRRGGLDFRLLARLIGDLRLKRFCRALFTFMEQYMGVREFPFPPLRDTRSHLLEYIIRNEAYQLKQEREKEVQGWNALRRIASNLRFWLRRSRMLYAMMPDEAVCFPLYLAARKIRLLFARRNAKGRFVIHC